ncbi:MAG: T9SS type A sorting domain-containing protein [Chitinophagales bacterium]|nr:T9SS type A sorting domain-containing protein [Chitinophagales bacterium]
MKAQLAPWVYVGGSGMQDEASQILNGPSGEYISIINGGESDTITFSVIRLDHEGNLIWFRQFGKNDYVEYPNNLDFSEDSALIYITGFANADTSIWGIELDYNTGDLISTTEDWSDDSGLGSGVSVRGFKNGFDNYTLYGYANGKLHVYNTLDTEILLDSVSYYYPVTISDEKLIINDAELTGYGNILTGSYGPTYIPYVWLVYELDSIEFHEWGRDSILINGVKKVKALRTAVVGNNLDSSQIYFAVFDTIDGFPILIDILFPDPGYKIVAHDVVQHIDGSYYILTVQYLVSGTKTVLIKLDEDGNYISEQIILEDAGDVELTNIITNNFYDSDYPFVLSGFIDTETPEREKEYLIVGSDELGNFPECVFNCVWPGDADNSGLVDMSDLFPLGTGYLFTGPPRDIITDDWMGYNADLWPDSTGLFLNAKYADCLGDGEINEDDTTAIISNYGSGHAVFDLRLSDGGDFPIWLNTAGIILHSGYNEIPIMLGTEAIPIDEIYGVEFTISYEGAPFIVDSLGLSVYFIDSWFGIVEDELITLNYKPIEPRVDAGAVNTNYINKGGYGQIGKLGFIVEDNIAGIMIESGDSSIIFNITGATGVLNDLTPVMLDGSAYEVWAATGIQDIDQKEDIILYPNPWHGEELKVFPENYILQNFETYTIRDITGRMILKGNINSNTIPIQKNKLQEQGSYILELTGKEYNRLFHLIYIK